MPDLIDLTPEALSLLHAGAAHKHGFCCLPGQVEKNYRWLHEAERAGFLRFLGENPWITDAGRRAIGAKSQDETARAEFVKLCSQRRRLKPERAADPRTEFDYRSYRSMGWFCTLLIKQPDPRENPPTTRVGRSLNSDPQYLGPKNSIVQPESEGRFVLTLMPSFIITRGRLPTHPRPLDEFSEDFTDEERATWERLRLVCISINSRINNAGRQVRERRAFGETA